MKVTLQILPQIGCHGNVPWEIKKLAWVDNIHANTFYLVEKNHENRSSRSWDSFAAFKKKKEITKGKLYSPVGKFAERAKNTKICHWTDSTD